MTQETYNRPDGVDCGSLRLIETRSAAALSRRVMHGVKAYNQTLGPRFVNVPPRGTVVRFSEL